jgi:hypothetical protein
MATHPDIWTGFADRSTDGPSFQKHFEKTTIIIALCLRSVVVQLFSCAVANGVVVELLSNCKCAPVLYSTVHYVLQRTVSPGVIASWAPLSGFMACHCKPAQSMSSLVLKANNKTEIFFYVRAGRSQTRGRCNGCCRLLVLTVSRNAFQKDCTCGPTLPIGIVHDLKMSRIYIRAAAILF